MKQLDTLPLDLDRSFSKQAENINETCWYTLVKNLPHNQLSPHSSSTHWGHCTSAYFMNSPLSELSLWWWSAWNMSDRSQSFNMYWFIWSFNTYWLIWNEHSQSYLKKYCLYLSQDQSNSSYNFFFFFFLKMNLTENCWYQTVLTNKE